MNQLFVYLILCESLSFLKSCWQKLYTINVDYLCVYLLIFLPLYPFSDVSFPLALMVVTLALLMMCWPSFKYEKFNRFTHICILWFHGKRFLQSFRLHAKQFFFIYFFFVLIIDICIHWEWGKPKFQSEMFKSSLKLHISSSTFHSRICGSMFTVKKTNRILLIQLMEFALNYKVRVQMVQGMKKW